MTKEERKKEYEGKIFTGNNNEEFTEVSSRWLCFEHFIEDLPKIENFDKWIESKSMHLDKDLKGNSRLYSLNNCIFLTNKENANAGQYRCK